jgi:hypothetical protein
LPAGDTKLVLDGMPGVSFDNDAEAAVVWVVESICQLQDARQRRCGPDDRYLG